ncbi:coiled-coil domain-containing protein [Flammeovirga agarivorans]|uniref:Uncharacterized protein n=1 Tax=Flammeovirga agarivorans TaxID=2726742 RepID=A0A7X8SKG5_9BACT|nr:hypothetical protein [Flammeovirga agarivorans]NLR91886.1 hypothetical protein [Flammeovirga agarivorans]
MEYLNFFTLSHCVVFACLFLIIGFKKEGFSVDSDPFKVHVQKSALFGGFIVVLFSLMLLLNYIQPAFIEHSKHPKEEDPGKYASLYISYAITLVATFVPLITKCLKEKKEDKNKGFLPYNSIGLIAIVLGSTGLISTLIFFFSGEITYVDSYVSYLSHFIPAVAGLVAILGETFYSEKNISKLTDLGKVLGVVLFIGFSLSSFNASMADKQSQQLNKRIEDAHKDLDDIIKKSSGLDASLTRLTDVINNSNIIQFEDKVDALKNTLAGLSKNISALDTKVKKLPKKDVVEKVMTKVTAIEALEKDLLAKVDQLPSDEDINAINTHLTTLEEKDAHLETQINKIPTSIQKINEEVAKLDQTIQSIKEGMLDKEDINRRLDELDASYKTLSELIEKMPTEISKDIAKQKTLKETKEDPSKPTGDLAETGNGNTDKSLSKNDGG